MGVYTSTSCGSCGANWEFMSYGRRNQVGPPYVKCKVCNAVNKTSSKLYRDIGTFRRIYFWLDQGFSNLFFGIGGFSMVYGFVFYSEAPDVGVFLKIFITLMGGGLGVFQFYNLFTTPKQIRNIEELYDKNGGFLWSDEQY